MVPRKPSEVVKPTDAERREIVEYALDLLDRYRDRDSFLETGKLYSSIEIGGGTHGDLTEARSIGFNRQMVCVYRPCEREVTTARDWHTYCRKHGYPACAGVDHPADYPPFPSHGGGVWAGLTWKAIRRELQAEADPQLDLLGAAA